MPKIVLTPQDAASFREVERRVRYVADEIGGIAKMIDESDLDVLDVEMYDTLVKSIRGLERYAFMAKTQFYQWKENEGHYVASEANAPDVRARRLKKVERRAPVKKKSKKTR